jgi:homoserine dehydrogenase
MLDSIDHAEKRRPISWGNGDKKLLRPLDTLVSRWYVRFAGDKKALETTVPVDSLLTSADQSEYVAATRPISTAEMEQAIDKLNAQGEVISAMRLL